MPDERGPLDWIAEVRRLLALRDAVQAELPALSHAMGQLSAAFQEIQGSMDRINNSMKGDQ